MKFIISQDWIRWPDLTIFLDITPLKEKESVISCFLNYCSQSLRCLHECAPALLLSTRPPPPPLPPSSLPTVLNRKQWFSSRSCISGHTMPGIAVIASFVLWTLFRPPNEETAEKKRDFRGHTRRVRIKVPVRDRKEVLDPSSRNARHFSRWST